MVYNSGVLQVQIDSAANDPQVKQWRWWCWRLSVMGLVILAFTSSYLAVKLEKAQEKIDVLQQQVTLKENLCSEKF